MTTEPDPTVEGWERFYPIGSELRKRMKEIQQEGRCPFCLDESGRIVPPNEIAARTKDWRAIPRWPEPYENAVLHWLLIPVRLINGRHLTSFDELTADDLSQIKLLVEMAASRFPEVPFCYGLGYRQGVGAGRTMNHLHIHLIAPRVNPETGQTDAGKHVNFQIG